MGPRIGIGRTFGESLRLLGRDFVAFAGAAYLLYLPLIALVVALVVALRAGETSSAEPAASTGLPTPYETDSVSLPGAVALLGRLVLAPLVTAACVRGALRRLRGEAVTLADTLRLGRPLVLPLVGQSLIIGVVAWVAGIAILPGLMVWAAWFVAPVVLVIERRSVVASLRRSWDITIGHRLRIFFFVCALWIGDHLIWFLATAGAIRLDHVRFAEPLALLLEPPLAALAGLFAAFVYFELRRVRARYLPDEPVDLAALLERDPADEELALPAAGVR